MNRLRMLLSLAMAGLAVPVSAHASFLHGETLDSEAMGLAWFIIVVMPIVVIGVFWKPYILPEKIAQKRHPPHKDANQVLCVLSLMFDRLLRPIAWLWANTRPTRTSLAYGTDKHEEKVHIVQSAIDFAHAQGLEQPKVAILCATQTVNPQVPSTIEAAALCKMAERGQITGSLLDAPLALDNAIDLGAAKINKTASPVAGQAHILVVPDLEAGNMRARSLSFMDDADAAGIVLGVRVPIILTSRADSVTTRLASCAAAALFAKARREDLKQAVV